MGKYRILVIDDDEDARRLIGMALRPRYEVVESCDGLDALSRLDQIEPDLAIIDIMMPMMDGYQVCEAIPPQPALAQSMQVMFLSAYGTKDNIKKGYAAGANLFLTKPVDPERLLKNIDLSIAHEPPPVRPKRHTLADLERMGAGQESEKDGHPAEPPERAAVTPPPPSPTPAKFPQHPIPSTLPEVRPRILMVDDDEEMLKMLDLALRDDFETVTAVNGMEAIERMVEYQPDLLLIDIMMPKMNGYQLLQSVRRNAYFGTMPIVVLSAKSTPRDQEYAAKMGRDALSAQTLSRRRPAQGAAPSHKGAELPHPAQAHLRFRDQGAGHGRHPQARGARTAGHPARSLHRTRKG